MNRNDAPIRFLPFAMADIGEEEQQEVLDTMKNGWLTTGPKSKRFELEFAEALGVKHALAVNSCTAALHLALDAVKVGPHDEVITSPYTFTATAEVVRYMGADPIFADIDPITMNISPAEIEKAITPRTKAIIPVHFAGQACEMDKINELARHHKIHVIEDAAHALPCAYKGRPIGSFGDITAFSFYATKTLAVGEGGMITTNNDEWARRMKLMRLHGISSDVFDRYTSDKPKWFYEVVAPGYKYNLTDIAAAIGIHQLKKIDLMWQRRKEIARKYSEGLANLPVELPIQLRANDVHAWHLFTIKLKAEELNITRDFFIDEMNRQGIGLSVHFIPLHIQPYWRDRYKFTPDSFPIAYNVFKNIVSLPIYSKMSDDDVDRVINTTSDILKQYLR